MRLVLYIGFVFSLAISPVLYCGSADAQTLTEPDQSFQELAAKRDALKAEQEFLLFRRAFYDSDSKYLVLELSGGKGYLMYRNRILRTFKLERTSSRPKDPLRGIITMTGKVDGSSKKRMLLFGKALSLHAKKKDDKGSKTAAYRVGRKDLAAMYYALEKESMAYVK